MALRINITERQRRIGAELRKARRQAGIAVGEGGRLIGMSGPHLTHVESGRTGIPSQRLRELLKAYGYKNEEYIDALVDLAESKGRGWWTEYRKSLPQRSLDLAELESRATAIQSYETLLIPGLLQTEAYMRALFCSSRPGASPTEIDTLVRYRRARQQILADGSPTAIHAVIHEAALRIIVGSSDVMRDQLTHLLRSAQRPGTTIQILPFDAGARAWFGTPLLILGAGVPGLETVIVEHPAEPLRLGDIESIARYRSTFDSLSRNSLPRVTADGSPGSHERRDSWGLIHHVLYTY
ncbi:helix-turn-helix domain-containing protein [Streptomyces sp. NBC_01381]|uniref:helix-turn-helix domain-containing protein n=1 Tax=Streptomyces sp. NBC_01381 TaxID=2903845 RepID=UPI00224D8FEE|nr:helix-turn-helix transcriptional regulator [Streptomyces sp. NBC_01381]MCX4665373.1 helix-turn-helix domain-containing protein [Streptomyces sp. NBC_01381]